MDRKYTWLYAFEGTAAIAALLIAGCSTTAAPVMISTPPVYSTTTFQLPVHSVHSRSHTSKTSMVTASRYDPKLAGNCTSNGESYDPKSLTAASRNLPMGSTVKVTNVDNGRSTNVRINDRGPYVHGRSLDLSERAAEKIGIGDKGVAKVKVTRTDCGCLGVIHTLRITDGILNTTT
jgi:rare lipoprotein A